jgi:hypothetical protein
MTDDGDPSTGLAFSSTMRPDSVADMMSGDGGSAETTTYFIYRNIIARECSSRCEVAEG